MTFASVPCSNSLLGPGSADCKVPEHPSAFHSSCAQGSLPSLRASWDARGDANRAVLYHFWHQVVGCHCLLFPHSAKFLLTRADVYETYACFKGPSLGSRCPKALSIPWNLDPGWRLTLGFQARNLRGASYRTWRRTPPRPTQRLRAISKL